MRCYEILPLVIIIRFCDTIDGQWLILIKVEFQLSQNISMYPVYMLLFLLMNINFYLHRAIKVREHTSVSWFETISHKTLQRLISVLNICSSGLWNVHLCGKCLSCSDKKKKRKVVLKPQLTVGISTTFTQEKKFPLNLKEIRFTFIVIIIDIDW